MESGLICAATTLVVDSTDGSFFMDSLAGLDPKGTSTVTMRGKTTQSTGEAAMHGEYQDWVMTQLRHAPRAGTKSTTDQAHAGPRRRDPLREIFRRSEGDADLEARRREVARQRLRLGLFAGFYGAGGGLFASPAPVAAQDTDASAAKTPFGFRWFVPELSKHCSIRRDVLLALEAKLA